MTARQLITAFLSILLLAGGPSVGAVPQLSDHAGMEATYSSGCGGLVHEAAQAHSDAPIDCSESKQSHCRVGAPQCSFASVYGLITGPMQASAHLPGQFVALASRTAYQNPIPEVLTPPPDFLS